MCIEITCVCKYLDRKNVDICSWWIRYNKNVYKSVPDTGMYVNYYDIIIWDSVLFAG